MTHQASKTEAPKQRALLVAVYRGSKDRPVCDEHLEELAFLAETHGIETAGKESIFLRLPTAAHLVSKGKLEDLVTRAKELAVDLVIFDEEITPAQQRNLEKEFGIDVIDRTELIIGVFAQRAHTKEAQLQVELAEAKYQYPRLKRLWTHLSRQRVSGAGGGYLKGMGEKQIEVDRRLLKNRVAVLEEQIAAVRTHRINQRQARMRSRIPVLAIIGYTNVGKSTLLNALTDAGVFVEDKLFATLDTTTRKFSLPDKQEILLIDTVGFIRKLPHLLVAAFKSTLEESFYADILLHVVDVSHPNALEQADASLQVLKELKVIGKPIITILNKTDALKDPSIITKLRLTYPKTVLISAKYHTGFDDLFEMLIHEINKQRRVYHLRIPQKDYSVVSELERLGHIHFKEYDGNDILISVDLPPSLAGKLTNYMELG